MLIMQSTEPTSSRQCPFTGRSAASTKPVQDRWPPGPKALFGGWGLLGQMARDTLGSLTSWQRKYGDLVYLRIWPENLVVVMHPELMRELLVRQHDDLIRWERVRHIFAQLHGNSVLVAEGDAWRAKRKALQPAFSPAAVQSLVPKMAQVASDAFAHWPAHKTLWPVESEITAITMEVIASLMFTSAMGEESRAAGHALRVVTEAANREFFVATRFLPKWLPSQRRKREAIAHLTQFIDGHIQSRLQMDEALWPDDLLTRLLRLHRADPQTWRVKDVHDECMTAFLAGHETVASTLTWWAWCMASNPDWQQRIADEARAVLPAQQQLSALNAQQWQALQPSLSLLNASIQESMRLYPAAPLLMSRRNNEPVQLGEWQFPAGTLFMLPLFVGQMDGRWFHESERFDPARFIAAEDGRSEVSQAPRSAWMPFGTGPRVCLGQHLATAEMSMVAAMLLQRWQLAVPQGAKAPRSQMHVTLRPAQPLHLLVSPRDV